MQNALTDAVRRLRLALGDTQQAFAQRTGLAISTIVRYELSRPARGKALGLFRDIAERNGLHNLAQTFAYAMGQAPDTAPLHSALDSLWWNRQNLTGWPRLAHCLTAEFQSLIESKRRQPDSIAESLDALEAQLIKLRLMLFATATDKLNEAAAKTIAEHPTFSWDKAYGQALLENPELYAQYLQERRDAARGTAAEASLAVYGTRQHAARKRNRKEKKS